MLLRFPVLPELEFVLEGEEVFRPPVLLEEGEEGRESCFRTVLRLNIGNLETRLERLVPTSPIRTKFCLCSVGEKSPVNGVPRSPSCQ